MNDTILTQLKTIVERAVRPVTASRRRKRQMREELLAHLTAVFDEERATCDVETTALQRARQRFGDPRELTEELEKTVTRWNRAAVFFERMDGDLQPNDSQRRIVVKLAWMTLATFCATQLGLLPSLLTRGKALALGTTVYTAVIVSLFMGVFSYGLFVGSNQIRRAFYGDATPHTGRPPSWRRAMPFLVGSLAFFPALGFSIYWVLVGDMAASLHNFRVACWFAPLAPLMLIEYARKMAAEENYKHEWADLKVDD
jgi:hypothetical protein